MYFAFVSHIEIRKSEIAGINLWTIVSIIEYLDYSFMIIIVMLNWSHDHTRYSQIRCPDLRWKGRILLGRKHGKDTWINIGGRVEDDEDAYTCLRREIREELSCDIEPEIEYFTETLLTSALDDPGKTVQIIWHKVTLSGEAKASSELEEIMWLDPQEAENYKLSPQIVEYLLPILWISLVTLSVADQEACWEWQ